MSLVISIHAWEGVGTYCGVCVWTITLGWASCTVSRPRMERLFDILHDRLDRLEQKERRS